MNIKLFILQGTMKDGYSPRFLPCGNGFNLLKIMTMRIDSIRACFQSTSIYRGSNPSAFTLASIYLPNPLGGAGSSSCLLSHYFKTSSFI